MIDLHDDPAAAQSEARSDLTTAVGARCGVRELGTVIDVAADYSSASAMLDLTSVVLAYGIQVDLAGFVPPVSVVV